MGAGYKLIYLKGFKWLVWLKYWDKRKAHLDKNCWTFNNYLKSWVHMLLQALKHKKETSVLDGVWTTADLFIYLLY